MLDPKRCTIERNPIVGPDGRITYTATMTFHIREDLQVELEQRDLKSDGALDPRVVERLHKLVWKAIYGDLLQPVTHLIAQAKLLCNKSMPQPEKNVNYLAGQLITLLKLRITPRDAGEKNGQEPRPGSS